MADGNGRRLKKLRRRQRAWVEDIADALLDAEDKAKQREFAPAGTLRPEDFEKADRESLRNPQSLEIFVMWYTLGGIDRGLSLSEIVQMPLWLQKDFRFIFSVITQRRGERERLDRILEEDKPQKGKRHGSTSRGKRR